MTFEGLDISSFKFTEVLESELPYHVAGYAKAMCYDPSHANSYQYVPPKGWKVTSCIWMPPGTHGVPSGQPTVLVWCEPESKIVVIDESPSLFPQLGGLPGFIAAGIAAVGLLIGYGMIARKQK